MNSKFLIGTAISEFVTKKTGHQSMRSATSVGKLFQSTITSRLRARILEKVRTKTFLT